MTEIEYLIDVGVFSLTKEKYIGQLVQYLGEEIKSSDVSKDRNKIKINIPDNFSKRVIKLRVNKFLYQAGFKYDYRVISTNNKGIDGYEIVER